MCVIYSILTLILLSAVGSLAKINDGFYNSLKTLDQVKGFVQLQYEWAGELVVESDDGQDIVMAYPHNFLTIQSCLLTLTEQRRSHQKVIFDIHTPRVLKKIAVFFDKRHDFVFLLLRSLRGPNGKSPKFGSAQQLDRLLRAVKLPKEVQLGLGYTNGIGPLESYEAQNFFELKAQLQFESIASRAKLLEFDLMLISNTDTDVVAEEVMLFTHILLRTANAIMDGYVNVEKIKEYIELGAGDKLVFSISDGLRGKILGNAVESLQFKNGGIISIAVIALRFIMKTHLM